MNDMVRLRREQLAYLREARGMQHWHELAAAAGMPTQVLSRLIRRPDISGVRFGTVAKLCQALSTPESPVGLADLAEFIPD